MSILVEKGKFGARWKSGRRKRLTGERSDGKRKWYEAKRSGRGYSTVMVELVFPLLITVVPCKMAPGDIWGPGHVIMPLACGLFHHGVNMAVGLVIRKFGWPQLVSGLRWGDTWDFGGYEVSEP